MAAATQRAALQTALLSVRGLRRRRLGHVGPNHVHLDLDKWGRKKSLNGGTNGMPSNLLGAAGAKRPTPRASLVLGGQKPVSRRRNGANGAASAAGANANPRLNGSSDVNGKGLHSSMMEQQLTSMPGRRFVNGSSHTNGLGIAKEDAPLNGDRHTENDASPATGKGGPASDLVVVLDMDECIIHSQFLSDQMVDKYRQYEDRPPTTSFHQGNNEEAIMWSTCDSFRINLPDGDLVNVNKRPNLDLFLREITAKFETYIFTAAMEIYAAPVLDKLDPSGDMFRGRFYREHCVYDPDMGVYSKDLCEVLRTRKMTIGTNATDEDHLEECDERRVVLVDNNPLSFLPNPSNGILVSSFYDDPKDDTLEAVMELLHELDESDDVRPILDDRFGLKDALDDVVKGSSSGW